MNRLVLNSAADIKSEKGENKTPGRNFPCIQFVHSICIISDIQKLYTPFCYVHLYVNMHAKATDDMRISFVAKKFSHPRVQIQWWVHPCFFQAILKICNRPGHFLPRSKMIDCCFTYSSGNLQLNWDARFCAGEMQ